MEPGSGYNIRAAPVGDVETVAALSRIAQELHREAAPERFKAWDMAAFAAFFADELTSADTVILLAEEEGGEPVGYLYARESAQPETAFAHEHTTVHIHQLAVSPSHRRGGVATGLMRTIENEARARNADDVTLVHWDFNSAAAHFFHSRGYTPQSHRLRKML